MPENSGEFRERTARWAPPTLLIAVALCHLALTQTTTLTPWKGGGFGMFTVVDSMTARVWSLRVEDEQRATVRVLVRPGPLSAELNAGLQSFPTEAALERAADLASELRYQSTAFDEAALWDGWGAAAANAPESTREAPYAVPAPQGPPGAPASGWTPSGISIQMLRPVFSVDDLTLRLEPFGPRVERTP